MEKTKFTNKYSSIAIIKAKLQNLGTQLVFVPVVVCREYYMGVLKKKILNSSILQAMHSAENQIVDRHITSIEKLKALAEFTFKFRFI